MLVNVNAGFDSASSAQNKFLSEDGMLDVAAVARLNKKILTAAKKISQPVVHCIYYTRKPLGNYLRSKAEKKDADYLATRIYPVRTNQRPGKNITVAQAAKMVKGTTILVEVGELPENIRIEVAQFISACAKHNRKISPVANKVKAVKAKIREGVQKDFEVALKKAESLFGGKEIVESQSMFGKTAIIKIDADTFLSIGPSSKEKFSAAKKRAAEQAEYALGK